MKYKRTISRRWLFLNFLLVASSLQVIAQKKVLPPTQETPPPISTFKVLGAKSAAGKVVKGAPYAATATTETVQTLSDGNQIIRKNEAKLFRDSEGRTRTEQTLETIGKWAANRKAQHIITIHDPVAGVSFSLDPETRTAIKVIAPPPKTVAPIKSETTGKPIKVPTTPSLEAKRPEAKYLEAKGGESLGSRMIEGIEAEGVRVIRTIPAGEIGNVKPIEIMEETWYAPELQIVVLRKQHDPRSGEVTYQLMNLTRSEPAPALFEVPADYTIISEKPPTKPMPPKEEK